jgi:hypothetical protein
MEKKCEIKQFSDQSACMQCGQAWDVNDPFPPECPLNNKTQPVKWWNRFLVSLGMKKS